jgi:hypothetical protein
MDENCQVQPHDFAQMRFATQQQRWDDTLTKKKLTDVFQDLFASPLRSPRDRADASMTYLRATPPFLKGYGVLKHVGGLPA